ncbi:MAG: hypothetical protein H6726_00660 [Sandaracinaceae bacterium]|nr:hypothetical protein [Myxococcales bacterium]MCB9656130.1 hypothetical protein [Sandaracinaceae bacterium]
MATQRALRLLACAPLPPASDGTERVRATIELGCGCVVTRDMAADRIQQTVSGDTLVVGKFPCREHGTPS